jgi:signal transduction histidine kinase
VDTLVAEIAGFEQAVRRIDADRVDAAVAGRNATRRWLSLFTIGLLPLTLVVVWQFSDRISRRIATVANNATLLGQGTPLAAPLTGGDEIARLDAALHQAARRLADSRAREQRDAAELESRAAALAEANRNLEFKTKENETFVYSASHDLRSPLVNLQGFTQEIAHGCDSLRKLVQAAAIPPALRREIDVVVEQDIVGSLRFIQVAVMRLSAIIDALLRLSRAGRVQYARVPVDLDAVVRRIVTALHDTLDRKGATVQVDPLPQVLGDPTAIEQVLGNLLANAVAYLDPQRPGRIEVGTADEREEGMATIFVRDNGLGIPEAHQSKLFVPFQRLHASAAEGEGVGLALVRQIVERLGGRVWVSSAEGAGSTFFVGLPIEVPEPAETVADTAEVC